MAFQTTIRVTYVEGGKSVQADINIDPAQPVFGQIKSHLELLGFTVADSAFQAQIEAQFDKTNRDALSATDFAAARTAIDNANSIAALRPILRAMLRLIWRIARESGVITTSDPGA